MKSLSINSRTKTTLSVGAVAFLCASGSAAWVMARQHLATSHELASRYTPNGYGGYTTRSQAKPKAQSQDAASAATVATSSALRALPTAPPSFATAKKPTDLIVPVRMAYAKGDYKQAETVAGQVVKAAQSLPQSDPKRPAALKIAARARFLQAFASARQHNMAQARERFAQLQVEASQLPDKGKVIPAQPKMGAEPEPTLLENAVYQHAVCTNALGDKNGAEREYMAFMKTHPDSPLVQASIKRIARLHGGDIPKEAEAVWQSAMKTAQAHDKEVRKQMSLCAPQCLAELLKRQGKSASVADLTREMKTSDQGTSLADLCQTAKRHGFGKAQGVALTEAGLKNQKLPLVALVAPGHFVLVEKLQSDGSVQVWNPTGTEQKRIASTDERATYPAAQWKRMWQGSALVLQ